MRFRPMVLGLLFLAFSCASEKQINAPLKLIFNQNQTIDVVDVNFSTRILKGLGASYQLADRELDVQTSSIQEFPFSDKVGSGVTWKLESKNEYLNLSSSWMIRLLNIRPVILAQLRVINHRSQQVRIDKLNPLNTKTAQGDIAFPSTNALHYLDIVPRTWVPKNMRRLDSEDVGNFVSGNAREDGRSVVIGAATSDRFRSIFEFSDKRTSTGNVHIDSHLSVQPGKSISSEWIYLDVTDDIFRGLEQWASYAGRLNEAAVSLSEATGSYIWYYYRQLKVPVSIEEGKPEALKFNI